LFKIKSNKTLWINGWMDGLQHFASGAVRIPKCSITSNNVNYTVSQKNSDLYDYYGKTSPIHNIY